MQARASGALHFAAGSSETRISIHLDHAVDPSIGDMVLAVAVAHHLSAGSQAERDVEQVAHYLTHAAIPPSSILPALSWTMSSIWRQVQNTPCAIAAAASVSQLMLFVQH
jgi:hypothetical protein